MTAREILAYAITHAPKGVKGGPYEGSEATEPGTPVARLRDGMRYGPGDHECALDDLDWIRRYTPAKNARVIRIVRARPIEATEPTLETARRRLAAVAESMTEHAYQEMASALEVDACRVGPSEPSAVEVLRELVAHRGECAAYERLDSVDAIVDRARRVLAASGPDPMPVVRAALRRWEARGAVQREQGGSHLRRASLDHEYQTAIADENRECAKYRKAGGK